MKSTCVVLTLFWCLGLLPNMSFGQESIDRILFRVWTTSSAGDIGGIFLGRSGGKVKIRLKDGTLRNLAASEISPSDRAYIDQVTAKFGETPVYDRWTDVNGRTFLGEWKGISGSQIQFLRFDNDQILNLEAVFLTNKDLFLVLQKINREVSSLHGHAFRIWSYKDGNGNDLKCIGQFMSLNQDVLTLSQMGATYQLSVRRLSRPDIDYLVGDQRISNAIPDFPEEEIRRKRGVNRRGQPREKDDEEEEQIVFIPKIWWISIGLVVLLMLGIISVKYIYESTQEE